MPDYLFMKVIEKNFVFGIEGAEAAKSSSGNHASAYISLLWEEEPADV